MYVRDQALFVGEQLMVSRRSHNRHHGVSWGWICHQLIDNGRLEVWYGGYGRGGNRSRDRDVVSTAKHNNVRRIESPEIEG